MTQQHQPTEVVRMAMEGASEVIAAVMERWKVPLPPQEELRARFEAVLNSPPEAYQAAHEQWMAEVGPAEWTRQMGYLLRRQRRLAEGG